MKLLKKQAINAQISENRRQQIEEGVKLAKKVDLLRNEVNELQKKRSDLFEEIIILEEKKSGLSH